MAALPLAAQEDSGWLALPEPATADFAAAQLQTGQSSLQANDFAAADSSLRQALQLFRFFEDSVGMAHALLHLGKLELRQARHPAALDYLYQGLTATEQTRDSIAWAAVLYEIGATYQAMQRSKEAMHYYTIAFELAELLGASELKAMCSNSIGVIYLQAGDYTRALRNFRLALNTNRASGSSQELAENLKNIGMIYHHLGVYLKALEYNREALEIERSNHLHAGEVATHNNLGSIFLTMGRHDAATQEFELAMAMSKEAQLIQGVRDAAKGLSQLYETQGDVQQAFEHYRLFRQMDDSLANAAQQREVARLRMAYEVERREKELARLRKNNAEDQLAITAREASIERQRYVIALAVGGGILMLVLVLLLYNRNQLRKRANEQLRIEILERKMAEEQLRDTNQELNTLMYRSSHDLKSPIASAIGLTNVAEMEVTDPAALKFIGLIGERMRYLDGMLTNLIATSRMRQGKLEATPIDFTTLLASIMESINQMPGFNSIDITSDVAQMPTFMGDKAILTTVLQNVLTNAVKYQDLTKEHCYCHIVARPRNAGVELVISDNGIGIEQVVKDTAFEMFSRGETNREGSGLGLYIVMSSVKKAGGTLELESEPGEGTTVIVWLPGLGAGKKAAVAAGVGTLL